MAFEISIYEKNEYLYKTLRKRIRNDFPESYIRWHPVPIKKEKEDDEEAVVNRVIVLYDNRVFRETDLPDYGSASIIPLFKEVNSKLKVIEYEEIRAGIENFLGSDSAPALKGPINLLFPYAYIEDREKFIRQKLAFIRDDHKMAVRLDLMAGSRMPILLSGSSSRGSLTTLLSKASEGRLKASEIPEYLNPGTDGFMSPGRPDNSEDVFDYGLKASLELISRTSEFVINSDIDTGLLVVAEGFRTTELSELAALSDTLFILLPEKHYLRNPGIQNDISRFKEKLPVNAEVKICFCDELKTEKLYETSCV